MRNNVAERFKKSCVKGYFDPDIWIETDGFKPGLGEWDYFTRDMLSYGNVISDELQRIYLMGEWGNDRWGFWAKPCEVRFPEDKAFTFWLRAVERFQDFSLFGEFMEKDAAPHLFALCERLCSVHDDIQVCGNNYFFHRGWYTEPPRKPEHKRKDLLLRIIRVLNNI